MGISAAVGGDLSANTNILKDNKNKILYNILFKNVRATHSFASIKSSCRSRFEIIVSSISDARAYEFSFISFK